MTDKMLSEVTGIPYSTLASWKGTGNDRINKSGWREDIYIILKSMSEKKVRKLFKKARKRNT